MQAAVNISAAEKHDSADAETASDAGVNADTQDAHLAQDDDEVQTLQKKLAQVTKTMRDTNARNESIIYDLQKQASKSSKQTMFASSQHASKLKQIQQTNSIVPSEQKIFSATDVRNAVPKVDDITVDQENLKQFRRQLRINEVHNLAATVVRCLENYDSRRHEEHEIFQKLHGIFQDMHFLMLCQCRNYMNWRQLYQPLATSSKTTPAKMIDTIKNYEVFERFFFHQEKTFVHNGETIRNANDMESFLRYNRWCNSMAECKEEFYSNDSDEKYFFAVAPYCEWQDFIAPTCQSEWILKFPSKWKTVRETFRVPAINIQKSEQKTPSCSSIVQASNVSRESSSQQNMQDSIVYSVRHDSTLSTLSTLDTFHNDIPDIPHIHNDENDRTFFLQVDSMHAASLINLIKIGDKQMVNDFEKHYFIEYGKFGVVLQKSNWAWFELDLLRASQADINFLIENHKLSPTCKHISYAEYLQIIIAKPSWLGQRFVPLFNPLEDMCLLTPPKHAVKEIHLKIANNDLHRKTISLYLLEPLGFMQWPALSPDADAISKRKHLLFKQFAVGLHYDTTASNGTKTAKQPVRYIHVVPMIEVKYNGAKRFAVDMQTLGNVHKQLQKIANLKIQFLTMASCLRALDTALVDSAGCVWMQLDLFNETQNSGGVPQSKKKKDIEHESSMRIKFQNLLIAAQYAREVSVLKII